jgi:RNA polymerase primary sigma factor
VAVQGRTIRLPVYQVERLTKISKVTGQLAQELGRKPELEEIAAQIGVSPEKVRRLLQAGQDTLSLEEPVGEDGATLADFIENDLSPAPEQVSATLLAAEIRQALDTLTPRESRIVEMRYGLRDGCPLTLEAVAERFGLTRERIRQIEQEALGKLRHPALARGLAEYLG